MSSTASTSSSGILCARWASGMPALLTRMSTVPSGVARPGHDLVDLGGVGDVEGHRLADPAASADLRGQLLQPVHPPSRGHDRRAGAGQRGGEAVAESGAGAGDQGDAAGEIGWFEHVAGVAPTGIGGATEGSPPEVHPFSKTRLLLTC